MENNETLQDTWLEEFEAEIYQAMEALKHIRTREVYSHEGGPVSRTGHRKIYYTAIGGLFYVSLNNRDIQGEGLIFSSDTTFALPPVTEGAAHFYRFSMSVLKDAREGLPFAVETLLKNATP